MSRLPMRQTRPCSSLFGVRQMCASLRPSLSMVTSCSSRGMQRASSLVIQDEQLRLVWKLQVLRFIPRLGFAFLSLRVRHVIRIFHSILEGRNHRFCTGWIDRSDLSDLECSDCSKGWFCSPEKQMIDRYCIHRRAIIRRCCPASFICSFCSSWQ